MSGIPIHSEDPISPAKPIGITPHTVHNSDAGNPSQRAKFTAPSPYTYPPAQPGAAASTPTKTIPHGYGPPAPQPGAAPAPLVSPPSTITSKPSLPPPPKNGEKPLSPEHYASVHSTPPQPQPYPSQLSQPTVDHPFKSLPPGSTTSASMKPLNSSAEASSDSSSTGMSVRASLEHPPGYVQNPFASDMTPDQRFAAEQRQEYRSDTLPSLGYIDNSMGSRPGLEEDETAWGTAKKLLKETGEQVSKLGEEVWDKFGPEK